MKRIVFTLLMMTLFKMYAWGLPDRINLENKGSGNFNDRTGNQLFFDIPEAYYDNDPKNPVIIIIGGGVVSYYDVEITTTVTNYVEITTQVNGTYDTFDVSSLAPGSHVITVESPSGNIYEGIFTSY